MNAEISTQYATFINQAIWPHKLNSKKKNHMSVLYMQCLDILNLIGLPDMVCMLNVRIWVNWIFLGCVCGWPGEHITQDCPKISWYNISITTNFGTCPDSTAVVACARFCHDLVAEISNTMRKWILVKFWFRTPHFLCDAVLEIKDHF